MLSESEEATLDKRAPRILVVEDDDDTREAIRDVLEAEGYHVTGLSNGRDALAWLEGASEPDVIILDLMMPTLNGWQFLNEQRQRDTIAKVPVLVLTADGRVSRQPASVDAAALLLKPVNLDDLLETVQRIVDGRED